MVRMSETVCGSEALRWRRGEQRRRPHLGRRIGNGHADHAVITAPQRAEQWYPDGTPNMDNSYTIGHDHIVQWDETNGVLYFLADGHGSTRVLTDDEATPGVQDSFDYDAYGNLLDYSGTPKTTYLYSGEQFNTTTDQYYLRARYYDPATGRFNRLDPFAGNTEDPASLHKYLYAGANPVMYSDPTGMVSISGLAISMAISSMLTQILAPVIKPAEIFLARALLGASMLMGLKTATLPDAVMVGFGGTFGVAYGPGALQGGAGTEVLYSPWTNQHAVYAYAEVKGSFFGAGGWRPVGQLGFKGGLVFGAPVAQRYTDVFLSFTFPMEGLTIAIQRNLAQLAAIAIGAMGRSMANPRFSQTASRYITNFASKAITVLEQFSVTSSITLFVNPKAGAPFGASLDVDLNFMNPGSFAIAVQYYWLVSGDPETPFRQT